MLTRTLWTGLVGCTAVGLAVWLASAISARAQSPAVTDTQPKPTSTPSAAAKRGESKPRPPAAREVTLTGRVVDLHGYMTGNYPSTDKVKCTADSIKAGVPAGLETAGGLILLGLGAKGPAEKLVPWAYQAVDVKGKLYLKQGARYLEITSIGKSTRPVEEAGLGGKGSTGEAAKRNSPPK